MTALPTRVDLQASLAITMLAVPQGIAYAVIAGLPPAAGLYAASIPVVIASALRSSHHVVTGPTNAVSLGGSGTRPGHVRRRPHVHRPAARPAGGGLQFAAGALRLGAIVDYISRAVVLGYITGAGLLIGLGQLQHITATPMGPGRVHERLLSWFSGLHETQAATVGIAAATVPS